MNLIPPQVELELDERLLIPDVSWETYEKFLEALGNRRIFATYDGASLELMSPSPLHETWAHQFAQFIIILAEELNLPFRPYRSTTWKRKDLNKGIEADDCFYFASLPAILGKMEPELGKDPPPDLAVEIDITSSSLNRQSIYAALGVPEIWRFDGEQLKVFCLGSKRDYVESERSPTFPELDLAAVVDVIQPDPDKDTLTLHRSWRAWVRQNVVAGAKGDRPVPRKSKKKPKR